MILAIDPGPEYSAWVMYDEKLKIPVAWGKEPNNDIVARLGVGLSAHYLVIEMIASYGMAVGADVFETCVWIGRYIERWFEETEREAKRLFRRDVKLHLCQSPKAKDSNVRQALIDRYGPGKEKAVGRKASPGPLYGLKADMWQALGVAITFAES